MSINQLGKPQQPKDNLGKAMNQVTEAFQRMNKGDMEGVVFALGFAIESVAKYIRDKEREENSYKVGLVRLDETNPWSPGTDVTDRIKREDYPPRGTWVKVDTSDLGHIGFYRKETGTLWSKGRVSRFPFGPVDDSMTVTVATPEEISNIPVSDLLA